MQIKQTKVFLQYKNSTSSYWEKDYMPFVDLDNSSGGYPYEVEINRAYDFKTIERAKEYDRRGEFDVRVVEITYKF